MQPWRLLPDSKTKDLVGTSDNLPRSDPEVFATLLGRLIPIQGKVSFTGNLEHTLKAKAEQKHESAGAGRLLQQAARSACERRAPRHRQRYRRAAELRARGMILLAMLQSLAERNDGRLPEERHAACWAASA